LGLLDDNALHKST